MPVPGNAIGQVILRWLRARSPRIAILAAAYAVIAGLMLRGALPVGAGLLALAVIALAGLACTLIAPRRILSADVTESRAQADAALMQDLISALPDPAILLKKDGRIVCFNAQATAFAPALRQDEPVSIAIRAPEVLAAIRAAATNGAPQQVEFSDRVPERWSEAFVTPMPPEWLVLTLHDLTPIRRVEEMRADFVANASHELRTPLAALSGFIDTLKGPAREDAGARARFLDIMQAQARRMARLIDDLLSLSRIELAAHLRPATPVELASLVHQVSDALQTLARDREVEIVIDVPKEPLVVPGDRDELIRALENLVENALKYGGSGKRVEVTLSRTKAASGGDEAEIAVRDYGPGIAGEHLPRLTERFYRVDIKGSRAQGGTGLGLALVKHILNHHGGRLAIESEIGSGATFTMYLPLASAEVGKLPKNL
jgi:two-component system phosphate regulon sensor histidine kinase PhoR